MKIADGAINEIHVSLKLNGSPLQVLDISCKLDNQLKIFLSFKGRINASKSTRATTWY